MPRKTRSKPCPPTTPTKRRTGDATDSEYTSPSKRPRASRAQPLPKIPTSRIKSGYGTSSGSPGGMVLSPEVARSSQRTGSPSKLSRRAQPATPAYVIVDSDSEDELSKAPATLQGVMAPAMFQGVKAQLAKIRSMKARREKATTEEVDKSEVEDSSESDCTVLPTVEDVEGSGPPDASESRSNDDGGKTPTVPYPSWMHDSDFSEPEPANQGGSDHAARSDNEDGHGSLLSGSMFGVIDDQSEPVEELDTREAEDDNAHPLCDPASQPINEVGGGHAVLEIRGTQNGDDDDLFDSPKPGDLAQHEPPRTEQIDVHQAKGPDAARADALMAFLQSTRRREASPPAAVNTPVPVSQPAVTVASQRRQPPDASQTGGPAHKYNRDFQERIARAKKVSPQLSKMITLRQIWALPKGPDGHPPYPRFGPFCSEKECYSRSVLRDHRGSGRRVHYRCENNGSHFVTWADRVGVSSTNPTCFCGLPTRECELGGQAIWYCWDKTCMYRFEEKWLTK